MQKTKIFEFLVILAFLFFINAELTSIQKTIVPAQLSANNEQQTITTEKNLEELGAPQEKVKDLAHSIIMVSNMTRVDKELLTAIVKTESNFKYDAKSSKNYVGLMQTPSATKIYAEVDILHGAKILQTKLTMTHGDLLQALALYKGGDNPLARRYAKETYILYNKLLERNKIKGVKV